MKGDARIPLDQKAVQGWTLVELMREVESRLAKMEAVARIRAAEDGLPAAPMAGVPDEIRRYPALGTCGGDTMHDGSALHPQCSLYSWRPRAEKEAGR